MSRTPGCREEEEEARALCCVAVRGAWEEWSPWSLCSVTCGRGARTRTRHCAAPRRGGKACEGPELQAKPCSIATCPGQYPPLPLLLRHPQNPRRCHQGHWYCEGWVALLRGPGTARGRLTWVQPPVPDGEPALSAMLGGLEPHHRQGDQPGDRRGAGSFLLRLLTQTVPAACTALALGHHGAPGRWQRG